MKLLCKKLSLNGSEIFEKTEACVEPVLTFSEACASEQITSRELLVDVKNYDQGTQQQIGNPIKMSKSVPRYDSIGSPVGLHNKEVLQELGLDESTIKAAIDARAFG